MTIAIDVREACQPKRTGKGQWTRGFVSAVTDSSHNFIVYTDADCSNDWPEITSKTNVRVHVVRAKGVWWHIRVTRMIKGDPSIDYYISPTSYIVPFLLGRAKKVIVVVHDLIAFRSEPHNKKASFIERLTLKRAAKNAFAICTVSETTKYDLLQKYSWLDQSKVTPIFAAPAGSISPPSLQDDPTTILCVGTLCPRKNQLRLIYAFSSLSDQERDSCMLVLIGGRGWDDADIVHAAAASPNVEWKDYCSNKDLSAAYSNARALAIPSLYEGFGMPIVEAMQAGIPVLTSNVGSMKEVADDAAVLVDPASVQSIADGLKRLIADESLRNQVSSAGKKRAELFTWSRTADIVLSLLT